MVRKICKKLFKKKLQIPLTIPGERGILCFTDAEVRPLHNNQKIDTIVALEIQKKIFKKIKKLVDKDR